MPKLIVIRGPAGAGKSTVARKLFEEVGGPIALVDLDYFRFMLRNQLSEDTRGEYRLAESCIEIALGHAFDVIFEGNFRALAGGELPVPLLGFDGATVHAFYMDVSLPETLRRHTMRADQRITAERMVDLYPAARPIDVLAEVVLHESLSVEQSVQTIRGVTGL